MRLQNVIHVLAERGALLQQPVNIDKIKIEGIESNSGKVAAGFLFVAIPGYKHDGHDFIEDAVKRGAAAVIGEREADAIAGLPENVPYVQVSNAREAIALAASRFYEKPDRKRTVIGITGTNGKTTTSFLLRDVLEQAGISCSLFGTIANFLNGEERKTVNTTPDALQLNRMMAESNDEVIILEVSSHAIEQYRVEGINFDMALFTNLSKEHLDYHGTMEEYFGVKRKLFDQLKIGGKAVVFTDTPWGRRLVTDLEEKDVPVITAGQVQDNEFWLNSIQADEEPVFTLQHLDQSYTISLPIPGLHNVYNAALAFAAASELISDGSRIASGLENFKGVPGRFEMLRHACGARFIIDYAHTTDAVQYCLHTAKRIGAKRIVHVFGFRGNRDTGKREMMVAASAKYSDIFILTFDDLNGIEPGEMEAELRALNEEHGQGKGVVITDRTMAIKHAYDIAQEGDWIFITGKGPETYRTPFFMPADSDRSTVELLLQDQNEKKTLKSS
ncbi:UDP-N-acetylmuramoyl-L-alanyl-D-glutamate--2,6-diaminopimelate ligase [Fictibacillus iocasae]|uniref:UDP-N-acetylmuramyl-tripeptide synthetase n=1 Tax=Fictibacillus iocasae TaxID=2715437 RepID=A0ABW2NLS9_9BACL